jgi:hypothetical protein
MTRLLISEFRENQIIQKKVKTENIHLDNHQWKNVIFREQNSIIKSMEH